MADEEIVFTDDEINRRWPGLVKKIQRLWKVSDKYMAQLLCTSPVQLYRYRQGNRLPSGMAGLLIRLAADGLVTKEMVAPYLNIYYQKDNSKE